MNKAVKVLLITHEFEVQSMEYAINGGVFSVALVVHDCSVSLCLIFTTCHLCDLLVRNE